MKTKLFIIFCLLLSTSVVGLDYYHGPFTANQRRAWELAKEAFELRRAFGIVAERTAEELEELHQLAEAFAVDYIGEFTFWLGEHNEGMIMTPGGMEHTSFTFRLNYLLDRANLLLGYLDDRNYKMAADLLPAFHSMTEYVARTFHHHDY